MVGTHIGKVRNEGHEDPQVVLVGIPFIKTIEDVAWSLLVQKRRDHYVHMCRVESRNMSHIHTHVQPLAGFPQR